MPKKSNFCETHNQIHHCEFTSVTFIAKKQEELISKRMNRLLNPSEYIKPSEEAKPKKGSFAHIIQNAKTRNEKLKVESNFLNEEAKDNKIDEKTLTNRIEQLKRNVLQDSNPAILQTNKKVKKTKKVEESNFSSPSATIQLTVEQTQELIDKAVKKALKDFKEK